MDSNDTKRRKETPPERSTDSDTFSDEDVDSERIPTLIVKLFLESITEVELLKKFRLVSKYWNLEACHWLRKLSTTTLFTDVSDLEDFHSVVNDGARLSLPSPFQKISIKGRRLPKNVLSILINSFGLDIKSLDLPFIDFKDLYNLKILFKEHSNLITTLVLPPAYWSKMREAYEGVSFSSLHTLRLSGRDTHHAFLVENFVEKILQGSTLTSLKIVIQSVPWFLKFASLDLTRYKNLDLVMKITASAQVPWNALANVQLPALRKLSIQFFFRRHDLQQMYSLLNRCAPCLEDLDITSEFKFWETNINIFPNLKSLALHNMNYSALLHVTHERFPRLEEIKISVQNEIIPVEVELVPHEIVHKLCVEIKGMRCSPYLFEGNHQAVPSWIRAFKTKFPNVNDVTMTAMDCPCILSCFHLFNSQLKSLTLTRFNGGWAILGRQSLEGDENFPSMFSFEDIHYLESLAFEYGRISNAIIQKFVARVPQLKYLRIEWSEELSINLFQDFLQHLKVLEISHLTRRSTLTELRAVMPGTLIKQIFRHP